MKEVAGLHAPNRLAPLRDGILAEHTFDQTLDLLAGMKIVRGEHILLDDLRTIRRLLIEQGDCAAFEDFAARLFDETVEFYDEYFSEHVIEKDGLPYSELHEMYWDEESQCWWRRDGGTITTTSFMPYKGTPLKIVPT